jgi:uncharacterized Rossmann fold enzyme
MANELVIDLTNADIADIKIKTNYCISQDLHDKQVQETIARGYPAIPATNNVTYDPIAVVCSGPTLKDTWEEAKKFSKIITVSGAHDFLVERGVIPTYHMEADPRPHKSLFVKKPQTDVKYLIASCCHKEVFDSLENHDVRIWHILGMESYRTIPSIYPRGSWVLTGGSNVGLRALVMARVLGHINIHVFGMDCSAGEAFHANAHPNEPKPKAYREVVIGERRFRTTEVFLEYARQFFKETMMLPDTQFTLHGDGLLQNLAIKKMTDPVEFQKRIEQLQSKVGKVSTIAVHSPEVISKDYAEQNMLLHSQRADYGIGGGKHAKIVKQLLETSKSKTVLDYGCGKGMLAKKLDFPIWEYDPAIEGKNHPPRPADLVVCTDVLEHIEPEYLDAVLEDIARCTLKLAYLVIHTGKSSKSLSDGRNAHLIQEDGEWWRQRLSQFFDIPTNGVIKKLPLIYVIASSKPIV